MNPHEQKIAKELGYDKTRPLVQFFDHAVKDEVLSQRSGRPRYRQRVYIRKVPSAPDLIVRDVFDRAMEESDKIEYPEEWAKYCERKAAISNLRPPITAMPGMDIAAQHELHDLGIYTCEDLANYQGNLDGLEMLVEIAQRIMEISDDIRERNLRAGRDAVRDHQERPVHRYPQVQGASSVQTTESQEKGDKEDCQTFSYSFQVG